MAVRGIFLAALLAASTTAEIEQRPPHDENRPHHGGIHGHGHISDARPLHDENKQNHGGNHGHGHVPDDNHSHIHGHGHGHGHDYGHDHRLDHGHDRGYEQEHPEAIPENTDGISNADNEADLSKIEVELENTDGSGHDQIIVERVLHRQRRQASVHDHCNTHDYHHGHGHHHGHEHPEQESIPVEPSQVIDADKSEESVDNLKRQQNSEDYELNTDLESSDETEEDIKDDATSARQGDIWVYCEFGTTPILSCFDCNSRVRCTRNGGRVLPCYSPMRPYCNNGICSAVSGTACELTSSPRK